VRFLAPLAYVSPRIIEAIANGSAPADLTVSTLARTLPHRWADQETSRVVRGCPPTDVSFPPEAARAGYLSMASIVCSSAAGEVRNRPV
jgi:hypothetical protein